MNDITGILLSRCISVGAVHRYMKFINSCNPGDGYTELHHILPRACWPEFENLSDHKWNGVRLSARQHLIAHWMLSRALGGSMTTALMLMAACNRNGVKINSRMYAAARIKSSAIISKQRKGQPNGHQGAKRSQETKDRMRAAQLGKKHTPEAIANIGAAKKGQLAGIPKSEDHKASLAAAAIGRTHSQDTKDKLSVIFKGTPKARVMCPHCNKEGAGGAMKQWHFDNCKHKSGEHNE